VCRTGVSTRHQTFGRGILTLDSIFQKPLVDAARGRHAYWKVSRRIDEDAVGPVPPLGVDGSGSCHAKCQSPPLHMLSANMASEVLPGLLRHGHRILSVPSKATMLRNQIV